MIIGVAVIIIIILAAVVLLFFWNDDVDDSTGVEIEDAEAQIEVNVRLTDLENRWGKVEARGVEFKCEVVEVEPQSWWDQLSINPAWGGFGFLKDEFDVTLKVRIVGPNAFEFETEPDKKTVVADEFAFFWEFDPVGWDTKICYVPGPGLYRVTGEIIVDAPDEGVNKEQAWSKTVTVSVP